MPVFVGQVIGYYYENCKGLHDMHAQTTAAMKKPYSKPVLKEIGGFVASTAMMDTGSVTDVPFGTPGPDVFS